jgi:hypothetical protein
LSAEAIAEQIGESWFDATIGGELIGSMREAAGGKVSTQQAATNQEIVDEFLATEGKGSEELNSLLEYAGGAAVARLAAITQRVGG